MYKYLHSHHTRLNTRPPTSPTTTNPHRRMNAHMPPIKSAHPPIHPSAHPRAHEHAETRAKALQPDPPVHPLNRSRAFFKSFQFLLTLSPFDLACCGCTTLTALRQASAHAKQLGYIPLTRVHHTPHSRSGSLQDVLVQERQLHCSRRR